MVPELSFAKGLNDRIYNRF